MKTDLTHKDIGRFLLRRVTETLQKSRFTNDMLMNFGIKELLKDKDNHALFYKNYQKYIEEITRRTTLFLGHNPLSINLKKAKYGDTSFYQPLIACFLNWFLLPKEKRVDTAKFLVIADNNLFDTRNFSKPSVKAFNIYDGNNTIPYVHSGVPLEYLIQEVAKDVIAYDKTLKDKDENILSRLARAIEKRTLEQERNNEEKQRRVIEQVTLNRIMKAIRYLKEIRTGNRHFEILMDRTLRGEIKKSITAKDLPTIICRQIATTIFSQVKIPEFDALSTKQQRLYVSMLIQKKTRRCYYRDLMDSIQGKKISVSLREESYDKLIVSHITKICDAHKNNESIDTLISKPLKHINKTRSFSGADKKLIRKALYDYFHYRREVALGSPLFIQEFSSPVTLPQNLFFALKDAGVTSKRSRKLIDALFTHEHGSLWMHDVCESVVPQLFSFLSKWSLSPAYNAALNSLISILTQQVGGAQGNSSAAFSRWRYLSMFPGHEKRFAQSSLKNLSEWIFIAQFDPASEQKNKQLIAKSGLSNHTGVALPVIIRNMGLSKHFHAQSPKPPVVHKNQSVAIDKPIIKHISDNLRVAILPYNDWLGILGVKVGGVCIGFDSTYHQQHYTPACANLVVYDDNKVFLWGLLIRDQMSESPRYLLNNLQGGLSSEYRKIKTQVTDTLRETLSEIGEVFTKQQFFNAINLLEEDDPIKIQQPPICTPVMRLDVYTETSPNNSDMLKVYEPLGKIQKKNVVIK